MVLTPRADSSWRAARPHILAQASILIVLALISYLGRGWGYFALYLGLLLLLGVAIGAAGAAVWLRTPTPGSRGARFSGVLARLLKSFALAELTVFVALAGVGALSRVSPGPIGALAGGPFRGDLTAVCPSDWSITEGLSEIQIQIPAVRPYSITTHFFVVDAQLFVGADFVFPFKQWVHIVERNPEVILRIRGKLYRCGMTRIRDARASRRILEQVSRMRGVSPEDWLTEVWFFRVHRVTQGPG
jgi:hypothetical protein